MLRLLVKSVFHVFTRYKFNPAMIYHIQTHWSYERHVEREAVGFYLCVLWQVEDGVQPLGVMVPGLLLVRQVPVSLRQGQKPADGAEVLPQGAVLRGWVLLPAKQLTQPTLETGTKT